MAKLEPPKEITKFFTPKFLNTTPPGIIYDAKIASGVYTSKGPKKTDPLTKTVKQDDRHTIRVEYQPQGQPLTTYEFGLTEENYKAFYTALDADDSLWLGALFNAQATQYPNLSTQGFVVIANSIRKPIKNNTGGK